MARRAGIYGRISLDRDGKAEGVERQREDGHSLADRLGVEVVGEYLDNDISAFDKRKVRPEFERLLRDLDAGVVDTIIVWRSDRLARQPRDLERVIDVLERNGGQLLSVTEPEFSGATGLLVLRMLGAFASHESQVKSERVARKNQASAQQGRWRTGGRRVFGYTLDGQPEPAEAAAYRQAVDLILAGHRPGTVLAGWQRRNITTTGGKRWTLTNFVRLLRSPRHAGIVEYHGERLAVEAQWQALVPRDRWEALQRRLNALQGGAQAKRVHRYPLTGLAVCGACGAPLGGVLRRRPGKPEWVEYRCAAERGGCSRVAIRAGVLEPIVLERFLASVGGPTFQKLVEQARGQTTTSVLLDRLREDEAALEQLTKDHYVERLLDRPTFLKAKATLDARIRDARRQVVTEPTILAIPSDVEVLRSEWEKRDPEWRRSVLESLIDRVVVAPTGGDRYVDRVSVVWKA